MNTLRAAIVPGLISGIIAIFTSWFWMGVVFHPYQKRTPDTWRAEGSRNYIAAVLLHFVAALGIACVFTLMVRFNVSVFTSGLGGSVRFAICVWLAIVLPILVEAAVFIRLHPLVVVGQLLDWLTTMIVSCAVTGWWLGH